MRKTSQDGGDSTSIISGVENEGKKPSAAVIKNKRNSIKRKVQTLSHESDDAVSEPLLQKEKEKEKPETQSAKFSMLKSKTDAIHNREIDKNKLLPDNKDKTSSLQNVSLCTNTKESMQFKSQPNTTAPMHNHMNTNVFSSIDTNKFITATKNQVLVEIDGCKQVGYNPSPLIFTTAKIHTDNKTKQMEPVQVTTVPILSTTEIDKTGKASSSTGIVEAIPSTSETKITDKRQKNNIIASTEYTADINSKYNMPNTTSQNKKETSDHAVTSSNLLLKDTTKHLELSETKFTQSVPKKIVNKSSERHDQSKIGEPVKNNLAKSFQVPVMTYKDEKSVYTTTVNVSKAPFTVSGNITSTPRQFKTDIIAMTKLDKETIGKKDSPTQGLGKMNEDANANTVTVQQPTSSSCIKQSFIGLEKKTEITSKEKVSKDTTSSFVNKQLPRQKNVVVEDTVDITSKLKPSGDGSSRYSNNLKFSKVIEDAPAKSQMSDRGANDVSAKTLSNLSANNNINIITTKITATSIATKPTPIMTTVKPTAAELTHFAITTTSVSSTTKSTSSKITSTDTKEKSPIVPSTSLQPKGSTPPTVLPSIVDNKLAITSTVTSVPTSMVTQSSVPSKLNVASSVKLANVNVSQSSVKNISTTTSNQSSSPCVSSKITTAKSTPSSFSISNVNTVKPVITSPAAKTSVSSKNNEPKSNEVNKDNKNLKT